MMDGLCTVLAIIITYLVVVAAVLAFGLWLDRDQNGVKGQEK